MYNFSGTSRDRNYVGNTARPINMLTTEDHCAKLLSYRVPIELKIVSQFKFESRVFFLFYVLTDMFLVLELNIREAF